MKKLTYVLSIAAIITGLNSCSLAENEKWNSKLIGYAADGHLVYTEDVMGYQIPDFSYAGYKQGEEEIPYVPTVKEISPIEGDNTEHIQKAINEVAACTIKNGHRGALLLKAGVYTISGSLHIRESGIVLRGEADDEDQKKTVILGTGNQPHKRTLLIVGKDSANWDVGNSDKRMIVADTTKVGSLILKLDNVEGLTVGDDIVVRQDITKEWLDAMGNGIGNDKEAKPWTLDKMNHNTLDIMYLRKINGLNTTKKEIIINAPIFCTLYKKLSTPYIYTVNTSSMIYECGVENIFFDTEYNKNVILTYKKNGEKYLGDENHASGAVKFAGVENGWVKKVTASHFSGHSFGFKSSMHITIQDCNAIDPVSIIKGGRRYGFVTQDFGQLILFKNCYGKSGRHHFVSNGVARASGNVYLYCKSENAYACSEGHRRWSQGFLFDNYKEISLNNSYDFTLGFYNRGRMGTTHGWGMVTGVAWNCDLTTGDPKKGHLLVQQPPIGQNYAIGCKAGLIDNKPLILYKTEKCGYIEGTNRNGLTPNSLYEAQLKDRLSHKKEK